MEIKWRSKRCRITWAVAYRKIWAKIGLYPQYLESCGCEFPHPQSFPSGTPPFPASIFDRSGVYTLYNPFLSLPKVQAKVLLFCYSAFTNIKNSHYCLFLLKRQKCIFFSVRKVQGPPKSKCLFQARTMSPVPVAGKEVKDRWGKKIRGGENEKGRKWIKRMN